MDGGIGPYPSSIAGSSVAPSSDRTGTVMRTCARGTGTSPVRPLPSASVPVFRSKVAATSARSWVRVRASSGPCRARAAAVVRSQIPAAVSAGRYAENQAIPSESGRNSTRRSLALLVWRFSMLSGWWRSRHVRTFERNRYGTRSPAGQPRAGFGASGSRKCASSAAAPAGSRFAVSSTMTRAWSQEIVPACKAFRVSGSEAVRASDSPSSLAAAPSLTVRAQATSETMTISWTERSRGDAAGGARARVAWA